MIPALPEPDRVRDCAQRLVDPADFKLGGILSATSDPTEIPSKAVSTVKARHLAALRKALAAQPSEPKALRELYTEADCEASEQRWM